MKPPQPSTTNGSLAALWLRATEVSELMRKAKGATKARHASFTLGRTAAADTRTAASTKSSNVLATTPVVTPVDWYSATIKTNR